MSKTTTRWLMVLLALAVTLPAADPTELALAELSFSFYTQAHGIRDGFLKYLAQDAIVFRPAPTLARPVYEKVKPGGPLLAWGPQDVVVAASDDLGMSWGPYTMAKDGAALDHGHYFSIWKREQGAWRLYLDLGTSHPQAASPVPDWSQPLPTLAAKPALAEAEWRREKERLFAREAELILRPERPAPFLELLDPGVVLVRDGRVPEQSAAAYDVPKTVRSWKAAGGELSRAGDFACVYGQAADEAPDADGQATCYSYIHVWQRQDARWRLIAEVMMPLPAPAK